MAEKIAARISCVQHLVECDWPRRQQDPIDNEEIIGSVSRQFEANAGLIAILLIARRVWRRMISSVMAGWFGAAGLYLGPASGYSADACFLWQGRLRRAQSLVGGCRLLWIAAFQPTRHDRRLRLFFRRIHISSIQSVSIGNHCLFGSHIYISITITELPWRTATGETNHPPIVNSEEGGRGHRRKCLRWEMTQSSLVLPRLAMVRLWQPTLLFAA